MFNEKSVVVRAWVNKIRAGQYTESHIPALGNLREVVLSVLASEN